MTLIAIIVCMVLDFFLAPLRTLRNYVWLDIYYKYLAMGLDKAKLNNALIMGVISLIPPLLIVLFLQWVFDDNLYNIPSLLFNIIVLYYCLGPYPLFKKVKAKVTPAAPEAPATVESVAEDAAKQKAEEKTEGATFYGSITQLYSVLFWFVILGPIGAFLYRLITEMQKSEYFKAEGGVWTNVQQILDWLPIRLVGLFYALVGNFLTCFTYWLRQLLAKPAQNENFIETCGYTAVKGKAPTKTGPGKVEEYEVISLVSRSVIILLVVLALMTLVHWVS